MLVLLSFGLVLLATILLVVGLLSDDGITLIYLSIAASATAAVVLWLAFRRARPADEAPAGGPAPLEDELPEVVDATGATAAPAPPQPTAQTPAATPSPAPSPAAAPEPEPVPAAAAAADEAWADDTDWEVDDLQFPIADYDDLSVAEIMPLLPQLYSDELDIVHERERTTKNRSTILARLEKLKETGTEADAEDEVVEDAPAAATADERTEMPVADDPTQVIEAPAPTPAPARTPAPSVSLLDDDEDDDAAFFPIADYDDLSVSQIVPLLSQLELDELEDVKAREQAGANRSTLIAEIDRYLDGELEAFSWDEGEAAPAEAPAAAAPSAAPEPAGARLPIAGYDDLSVADIRPLLTDLSDAELRTVLEHEKARDNRKTIVGDIERRLDSAPAQPAPARAATRSATKTATKARKATKKATKKATAKKAAKKAAGRFPIANYDDLTVAEIRPRLAKLSGAQLAQVRDRERAGAGRKTILDDIASRLS